MERPRTANSVKGNQIDMRDFFANVIEDLRMLAQRITTIEMRLNAIDVLKISDEEFRKMPNRHLKLRSLNY